MSKLTLDREQAIRDELNRLRPPKPGDGTIRALLAEVDALRSRLAKAEAWINEAYRLLLERKEHLDATDCCACGEVGEIEYTCQYCRIRQILDDWDAKGNAELGRAGDDRA